MATMPFTRQAVALAAAAFTVVTASALPARQAGHTTPMFVCGADEEIAQPIPLTATAVILAADGRLYSPCPQPSPRPSSRAVREMDLLQRASRSTDARLRRLAAQAFGRIQRRDDLVASTQSALLRDDDAFVRREAANAIAEVLSAQRGDLSGPALAPAEVSEATVTAAEELHAQLGRETDDRVAAAILQSLGRLRYPDDNARAIAEGRLMAAAGDRPLRRWGAMKGLDALVRQNARRPLVDTTRARLREIVASGPTGVAPSADTGAELDDDRTVAARTRRLALAALLAAGGEESPTIARAARDADWQVRRLAAARMDWTRPDLQPVADALLSDPVFQVRYEVLAPFAREAGRTGTCAPLVDRATDREPIVAMRALDLIPATCRDVAAFTPRLAVLSLRLTTADSATRWHVPARALAALARVQADGARPRLATLTSHPAWQVRATVATVAGQLGDEASAAQLARDPVPNVRTAALEALARMRSAGLPQAAIGALASTDHQLVRTAATVLRGVGVEHRAAAADALVASLTGLTASASDTSRDPRVAIIDRLGELLPAASASRLAPWLSDFDPRVRAAAAAAMRGLTGAEPPASSTVQKRYPVQPAAADLTRLPASATIRMAGGGAVELVLLGDDAPATVARFAELARAGHYNGLTFHRIAPNFVVQGGSPGANEYAGVPRFWRDEVGLESHLRGTVGVSTRGRDTGDAQIFINLVDSPRLDHAYTVFARVRSGMDVVDRMLEGATIESIVVR
jgi:cyclophilin family peptidyl-prolyl cis-trans isomerase